MTIGDGIADVETARDHATIRLGIDTLIANILVSYLLPVV